MATRLISALLGILAFSLAGCATCHDYGQRSFEYGRDHFAFRNGLRWTYTFDEQGKVKTSRRQPNPEYSLRCFSMARAAREFFYHAEFKPSLPPVRETQYRRLIRAVMARDSRCPSRADKKIVIPGFANLAEFSDAYTELIKQECGGAWRSYVQRGNWRMILPFSRRHQVKTAGSLKEKLETGRLPIIHIVDFPTLNINHAVLLTSLSAEGEDLIFEAYDPNNPGHPANLRFEARERQFHFERNQYFSGGPVNVYEVFKSALF